MEFLTLVLRTVLIYFIVFLIMRFMGKREIGKLSVFDLVISVMIAEIAVIVIEDLDRTMWEGIVPMVILMLVQVGMAFVALKNRKLRLLFDGKPSIIMAKGKLNRDVMRKQRYNLDDFMLQLRENQITRISDVEFAILETSGKLSIIPKNTDGAPPEMSEERLNAEPQLSSSEAEHQLRMEEGNRTEQIQELTSKLSTRQESKVIPPKYRFEILPIPLIMDGKVQDENLEKLEKTRFWLKNVLQEEGVTDFKEVFLCTIDHKGKLFLDKTKKPRR
ncbi:DUF421 domain-containing protein [Paenibacillus sp. FSL H8-0537]|uniref:DUF421 domain-containing protein n=2 Tax=Paenibacillus sp. FSL H8-0537 TaxID=2921399 RepID=UPI003100E807